jgi:hypothetical protein
MTDYNWLKDAIIEAYDNMAWGEILDEMARKLVK